MSGKISTDSILQSILQELDKNGTVADSKSLVVEGERVLDQQLVLGALKRLQQHEVTFSLF
jgi:hypothetical protein